jgi:hypothetical protein
MAAHPASHQRRHQRLTPLARLARSSLPRVVIVAPGDLAHVVP